MTRLSTLLPPSLRLLFLRSPVAQATPVHQSSSPSKHRSGDVNVVTSRSISVAANSSGNNSREISRTNSSGGATATDEDAERDNEVRRDTTLGMASPVLPPIKSSAVAESQAASSCHMPSAETEGELTSPTCSKGMGGGLVKEKETSPCHMSPANTEQDLDTPAHSIRIERGAPTDTGASPCSISPAETNKDGNCTPSLAISSGIANRMGVEWTGRWTRQPTVTSALHRPLLFRHRLVLALLRPHRSAPRPRRRERAAVGIVMPSTILLGAVGQRTTEPCNVWRRSASSAQY